MVALSGHLVFQRNLASRRLGSKPLEKRSKLYQLNYTDYENDVVKEVFSLCRGTITLTQFCLIGPAPGQWQAFTARSLFGLV